MSIFRLGDGIFRVIIISILFVISVGAEAMSFSQLMYQLGRSIRKADPAMMSVVSKEPLSDETLRGAIGGVEEAISLSETLLACESELQLPERLAQGDARLHMDEYTRAFIELLKGYRAALQNQLATPLHQRSLSVIGEQYSQITELTTRAHQNL